MQPGGGCDSQQLQQQQGPVVLTQTSSHWLTQRTNRDSRRSRTSDSSLASRRMRSARPACRIWKLSLKSCNRRVAVQIKPAFATGTEIDRKKERVQSAKFPFDEERSEIEEIYQLPVGTNRRRSRDRRSNAETHLEDHVSFCQTNLTKQ